MKDMRIPRFPAFVVFWAFGHAIAAGAEARIWRDVDGRETRAFLKAVKGQEVILLKDGREYSFPLLRLSPADREHLEKIRGQEEPGKALSPPLQGKFPILSEKELAAAPPISVELLEKAVVSLANEVRKAHKISELREIKEIAGIARAHSLDMGSRGFFSHYNPDGDDPTARARKAGFSGLVKSPDGKPRPGFSENIGRVGRYLSIRQEKRNEKVVGRTIRWQTEAMIARQVVQGFLDSPAHRENLLDPSKAYFGVGIAIVREHVYVTQNFF